MPRLVAVQVVVKAAKLTNLAVTAIATLGRGMLRIWKVLVQKRVILHAGRWTCAVELPRTHGREARHLPPLPVALVSDLASGSDAYPSATYAEGFAGPGVYAGGEPGSPIIAMQTLIEKVNEKPTVRLSL